MLGICGPPGAGKSTLAANLCAQLNQQQAGRAIVVPMDGFHLDNATLEARGQLPLKGIPASFDADGYVSLLARLRESIEHPDEATIFCPAFDRSIESTVPNAIMVNPTHRFIITEGNYLLLNDEPWRQIAALCDAVWYVDIGLDVLRERLIARHEGGGMSRLSAENKVNSTDLPNATLVYQSRHRASRILQNITL